MCISCYRLGVDMITQRASDRKIVFHLFLLLVLLLFAQVVVAGNQTQTLVLEFNSTPYHIVDLTRRPIIVDEPVGWDLLLSNGSEFLTFYYETSPINLIKEHAQTRGFWSTNLTFYTNHSNGYENISYTFTPPSVSELIVTPNTPYEVKAGNLTLQLPELKSYHFASVRGRMDNWTLGQGGFEFQTRQGSFVFFAQGYTVSNFTLLNNTGLSWSLSPSAISLDTNRSLSLHLPQALSNETVFFIYSVLEGSSIPLPYRYNASSRVIHFDFSNVRQLYPNVLQQELLISADINWSRAEQPFFSVWTDKDVYTIGEEVTVHVSPTNATSFLYLFKPSGDVELLTNSTFTPFQIGKYVLEASLYYQNKSEELTYSFAVEKNRTLLRQKTVQTIFGNFTLRSEQGDIDMFSITDDLFVELDLENLTNNTSFSIDIDLPFSLPEGVHTYLWMKKDSGTYVALPYELLDNGSVIRLFVEDGAMDSDEVENGHVKISFELFIPPDTVTVESSDQKRSAQIMRGKQVRMEATSLDSRMGVQDQTQHQSQNQSLAQRLTTNAGRLEAVSLVYEENIPVQVPSKRNFINDLIKFKLENLTPGQAVDVQLEVENLPARIQVWKFNSRTVEWYEFPFEVIDEHTLKITLIDGGLGDDDGVVNGIIEDDLGIIFDWLNETWSYRQLVNITNNHNSTPISNYHVKFSLQSSNVGSDFAWNNSALRFTQYDNTTGNETELDYWIESWDESGETAEIWVELDTLVGNATDVGQGLGITPVFMYYGASSETNTSNGTNTFLFFDDFNDGTLDTTSTWTTNAASLTNESNGYLRLSGAWNAGGNHLSSIREFTEPIVVEGSWRLGQYGSGQDTDLSICFMPNNATEWWSNSGVCTIYDGSGGGGSNEKGLKVYSSQSNGGDIQSTDWQQFTITYNSTTIGFYDTYTDSTLTDTDSMLTTYYLNLAADTDSGTRYGDVDYLFARNYIPNEPTVSLGSQEFSGVLNMSINEPQQAAEKSRSIPFVMNGTTKCIRGNCENVSVWYQYYSTVTPEQQLIETTTSAFSNSNLETNVSVLHDKISLSQLYSDWWNDLWKKRQEINISNTAGDLYNYSVQLRLNSSKVKTGFNWTSDYDAIRFVQYNNTSLTHTNISYWIEDWSSSQSTGVIWVKLPYLKNNKNTTIYMYYDNDLATTNSNPEEVFELYLNFSKLTIEAEEGGQNCQGSSPCLYEILDGGRTFHTWGDAWYVVSGFETFDVENDGSQIFEVTMNSSDCGEISAAKFDTDKEQEDNNNYRWCGSQTSWGATPDQSYTNMSNYQLVYSVLDSFTISASHIHLPAEDDDDGSTNSYYKDVRVRSYASPTPSASYGEEKTISYLGPGEYISSTIDFASADVTYTNVSWTSIEPTNTSLSVYSRTSSGAGGVWWNTDWNDRHVYNVSGSSTYTDFQVLFSVNTTTLNTSGKLKEDCSDIRFVYLNGTEFTELSHWTENCNVSGDNSTFWVNIPTIESAGSTIHMYYNNPLASNTSNGSDTFNFFDTFDGSDLDSGTWQIDSSDYSVSGGLFRINDDSVTLNSPLSFDLEDGYVLEGRVQYHDSTGYSGTLSAQSSQYTQGNNGGSDATSLYMRSGGNLNRWTGDGSSTTYTCGTDSLVAMTNNEWYILSSKFNSSGVTYERNRDTSYGPYGCGWAKDLEYISLGYFDGSGNGQDTSYDWVLVRKYEEIEPSTDLISDENYTAVVNNESNFVWSNWFLETNNNDLSAPDNRYVQYRVELETTNTSSTPQLSDIAFNYKIVTPDWTDMQGAGTSFTTINPYSCSVLNLSLSTCTPTRNVVPKIRGNFSLRMIANSSNVDVGSVYSTVRNVSVFIQPSLTVFTSSKSLVSRTQTTQLQVTFLDEASNPLSGYNLTFIDETGNGSAYTIGHALTDSSGVATINYTIPSDSSFSTHTLNVSYPGDNSQFMKSSSLTTTIQVTSLPVIQNVSASPSSTGFGNTINISANVTDEQGLTNVRINITSDTGSNVYDMDSSGDIYNYTFRDSWFVQDYSYTIIANNTDGVVVTSSSNQFSVAVDANMSFYTSKDDYQSNELVELTTAPQGSPYPEWTSRKEITISNTVNITNYPVKIDLSLSNFNFENAKNNGEDIRFTYMNGSNEENASYFIETWDASAESATIWVTIPNLSTSQDTTLYMYFGYVGALSESNGSEVFTFFDGFQGTSLDTATWTATGSASVSNGQLLVTTGTIYSDATIAQSDDIIFESMINWDAGTGSDYAGMITCDVQDMQGSNTGADANILYMTNNGGSASVVCYGGNGLATGYDICSNDLVFTRSDGVDYVLGTAFNGTNTILYKDYGEEMVLNTFNESVYLYLGHFTGSTSGTTNIQDINVSWARARKFINPTDEPTISYGSDEPVKLGLINSGNTDFNGYLRMITQRWTGSAWQNIVPPVIDYQYNSVNASTTLDVDTLWSNTGGWNTTTKTPGLYRVYGLLEDPSRTLLVDSDGDSIEGYYEFTILNTTLIVTDLEYENYVNYSVYEYETGDTVDWINVSVTAKNNTAFSANVTLNLLDNELDEVSWGPNYETKLCGDIPIGGVCEKKWNNGSSGYIIPNDASSGSYDFFWDVYMDAENGPQQTNQTMSFTLHSVPSNVTGYFIDNRINKPNSTTYTVQIINPWSQQLTDANIEVNCPPIANFSCKSEIGGLGVINIGNINAGEEKLYNYTIEANATVPSDNYPINITFNYTNPGNESRSKSEIGVATLEVRNIGILEITVDTYPLNATRGSEYNLSSYMNNTGDTQAEDTWLNYTLPSSWSVSSGDATLYTDPVIVNETVWNNISVNLGIAAELGSQTVRLDSAASDGRVDFILYSVDVFAPTSIVADKNVSIVNRGESILLTAELTYDNGSSVVGETISFYDETNSTSIGTADTNASGVAQIEYPINDTHSLGIHTINTSYNGSEVLYSRSSSGTTTIDVHEVPDISDVVVSPVMAGYGNNISVSSTVSDADDIDDANVEVTYPNTSSEQFEMDFTPPFTYSFTFNNTWEIGNYTFQIIANDTTGAVGTSDLHNITVKADLTLGMKTLNDTYSQNTYVNLSGAPASWWNTLWPFSIPFNITGITKSMTGYQQNFTVSTGNLYQAGRIKSDCSDIRFIQYNGSEYLELDYYIEDICNTSSSATTTFWVNISELNAPWTEIELYYGNTDATAVNTSPEGIFDFYDGFQGSSLDTSTWTATGSATVSNGALLVETGSVYSDNTIAKSDDMIFESKLHWIAGTGTTYGGMMTVDVQDMQGSNSGADANVLYMTTGGGTSVERWAGDGTTSTYNLGTGPVFTQSQGANYILGIGFNGSNTMLYRNYAEELSFGTFNESVYMYLGHFEGSGAGTANGHDVNVSWARARKFMSPIPSVSAGTENNVGSKIFNNGALNHSGYLFMAVDKNVTGNWQEDSVVINDTSPRFINSSGLDLDTIWNAVSWFTGVSQGTYRAYAELRGPNGDSLVSSEGATISNYWMFEVSEPDLLLNITDIRAYEVTDTAEVNWHIYTNELVDSGLNKTFNLPSNNIYRFEVDVKNIGSTTWNFNETNIDYYGFNNSWSVDAAEDIWYSSELTPALRRSDTSYAGGVFNGTVTWNTTTNNGDLDGSKTATLYFIANISSTESLPIHFRIDNVNFQKNDYSDLNLYVIDDQAPKLFSNTYALTPENITRGNSVKLYARWDDTIAQANTTYSTTTPAIFTTITNNSPQNTYNWTNFTITSGSTWYLGEHEAKILVEDESGNINSSLSYINFTVFGNARLSTGNINTSTVYVGNEVLISCKVVDTTNSQPISGYTVTFRNGTEVIGTNLTIGTGWTSFVYTDNSPGTEDISCDIDENLSGYYYVDNQDSYNTTLDTLELIAPTYSSVSSPSIANKGEYVTLSAYWSDNYELQVAVLEHNASGSYVNESTIELTGTGHWANFSYQIPASFTPGNMSWRQYANDTSSNLNQTPLQTITIYGWSQVSTSTLFPSSMQETNTTTYTCTVADANDSTLLDSYPVNFYYKNQTDPTYSLLGQNTTNASGKAIYSFAINDAGTYMAKCNISDNGLYNASSTNSAVKTLNVVSGSDIFPPKIVGSNYTVNTTTVLRDQCVLVSGLWDEAINYSYIEYNRTPSTILTKNVSEPYTGNWTNQTLCMNDTWQPGNYTVKLFATDNEGNTNDTLSTFTVSFEGRSNITYLQPQGSVFREQLTFICEVLDEDTGIGIANYPVTFYDSVWGYSIGSNNTNSSGYVSVTYDYTLHPLGSDDITCTIASQPSLYYQAQPPLTAIGSVSFGANMTANITLPTTDQIFHRSDEENLEVVAEDENGDLVTGLTVTWFNDSNSVLATGNETTWTLPNAYPLGAQTIHANVSKTNYEDANDTENFLVYGYSQVNLQTPTTGVYGDNTLLNVTCLVSDSTAGGGISNYEVNVTRNSTPEYTADTNATGHITYQVNTTTLTDGDHEFMCEITDDASQYYTKNVPFMSVVLVTVDTQAPRIDYNPTTNLTGTYAVDWILVNVTASDQNMDTVRLNWSETDYVFSTQQGNYYWRNMTGLTEGTYNYNATATDVLDQTNTTTLQTVTIDLFEPTLDVLLPLNESYTNQTSITLNYTVSDLTLDSCWYTLNEGVDQPLGSCSNTTVSGLVEGQNNITVYANDSVGRESFELVVIYRDTVKPALNLLSPQNITYPTASVALNYTASDSQSLDSCWYTIDGGSNQPLIGCTNTTLAGLSNSQHLVNVYANDTAGNVNVTTEYFTIAFFELVTTPLYPGNGSVLTAVDTSLNASTNIEATECNYTLDGALPLELSSSDNYSWSTTVFSLSQGGHKVSFTCTDGINTSTTSLQQFAIDTLGPQITFISPTPSNGSGRDVDWFIANVSLSENASSAEFEWTNASGSYNYSMSNSSLTNWYYNMSGMADNTYTYKVYATDAYGNENVSEEQTVIISTAEPVVIIHSPIDLQTYAQTYVDLNVTATKTISSWVFELNEENFTFAPNVTLTPYFGDNSLTVWATDTYGLTGNASLNFSIDASEWFDVFGTPSGLETSSNVQTGENASILFCWPEQSLSTVPQNNLLDCWPYRKTINLSTSSTLTDYQIKLIVNLSEEAASGKAQSDCSDLRFGYSNSSSSSAAAIPYWIESCNGLDEATVWVKMPRITGGSQVHLYYGNAYASDESDGQAVFDFFDEMDSLSSDDWGSNVARWASSNNESYPTVNDDTGILTADYTTPSSFVTELWGRGNASNSGASAYYSAGTASKYVTFYFEANNSRIRFYNGANNFYTTNAETIQKYTLLTDFSNDNYTVFINDSSTPAISLSSTVGGNQPKPILRPYYVRGAYIDRIAIRSYSSDHPTQSSLGAEQTPIVNATMQSELLFPDETFGAWGNWTATTDIPSGTNITFKILDATNTSKCGDLLATQLSAGYEVCGPVDNESIYLYAELTTDATQKTPTIFNWSIDWTGATQDSQLPLVIIDTPLDNSYNETEEVLIRANVTDDEEVDTVYVNITWNNTSTHELLELIQEGVTDFYSTNFTNTSFVGLYNFTIIANDTSNNVNDTELSNFTINSTLDLFITDLTFSSQSIEGELSTLTVNVSNTGLTDATGVRIDVNVSSWNGTKTFNQTLTRTGLTLSAGTITPVEFNWTLAIGTYLFDVYIDVTDAVSETDEMNNDNTTNKTTSSWEIFYGEYDYDILLADSDKDAVVNWTTASPSGNIFFYDQDASWSPDDLEPLNGTNDLKELDAALGLTGYNDSIQSLFDQSQTATFVIGGRVVSDIPITNSTNTSSFITGILWDSSDAASYSGGPAQDVIFITRLNESKQGYYGIYDFEIRIPSPLARLRGFVDSVERLNELT